MCDMKEQGYQGGSIRVGPTGVFDVALYGVKSSQQVKRASASSTTSLFNYPTHPATCYLPPTVLSIANPSDCIEALAKMSGDIATIGELHTWTHPQKWVSGSCAIGFVSPYQDPLDNFSRFAIMEVASTVSSICNTEAHRHRGGFMSVGPREVWVLSLYGVQTVETAKRTLGNDTIDLVYSPVCYPPPPAPAPVAIANPADCSYVILQIISEGNPRQVARWHERRKWTYNTCTIDLIPQSLQSYAIFSRIDIAREASIIQLACVNQEHGLRGGFIEIGIMGVFDLTVRATESFIEARANLPAKSIRPVSFSNTTTSLIARSPSCWHWPGPLPISHPEDCDQLLANIAAEGSADVPEFWNSQRIWLLRSCKVKLVPIMATSADFFYSRELFYAGSRVYTACFTVAHPYIGGKIRVGPAHVFDLQIWGVQSPELDTRGISPGKILKHTPAKNSTSLSYVSSCWQTPGPSPIGKNRDCVEARSQIAAEGPTNTPVLWNSRKTLTFGNCKIDLFPAFSSAMCYFTGWEIISSALQVSLQCDTRGGEIYIGGDRVFTVRLCGVLRPASLETRASAPAKFLNTTSLSYDPHCWSHPGPLLITNEADCDQILVDIAEEGPVYIPILWSSRRTWIFRSCKVDLIPYSPSSRGVFSRWDIIHAISAMWIICHTKVHACMGGNTNIGAQAAFTVIVWGVKNTFSGVEMEARDIIPPAKPLERGPKNTTVTEECFSPSPLRPPPITNPDDCEGARNRILAKGPGTQVIMWSSRRTWIYGSCIIDLIPLYEESADFLSRITISHAAFLADVLCWLEAHSHLSGFTVIGRRRQCEVVVYGAPSPQLEVSEITTAKSLKRSNVIPSPKGSQVPLPKSRQTNSTNNTTGLSEEPIHCWVGPPSRFKPITHSATECLHAMTEIEAEGPPDQLILWNSERQWTSGSCTIQLVFVSAAPIGEDTFTRNDIVDQVGRIHDSCGAKSLGFLGGFVVIGTGTFRVIVLVSPQSLDPAKSSNVTSANNNTTTIIEYSPVCFSEPLGLVFRVRNPPDCIQAMLQITTEGPPDEPVIWTSERRWISGSCMIELVTNTRPIPGDTFSIKTIVHTALSLVLECVTAAHGYVGGYMLIGTGVFHVVVQGTPTDPKLEARDTPSAKSLTLISANSTVVYTPSCFEQPHPPIPYYPILNPLDCRQVHDQIFSEGPSDQPVVWNSQRKWVYGSCTIELEPITIPLYDEDTLTRSALAHAALRVELLCATQAHPYMGGLITIGRKAVFQVRVDGTPIRRSEVAPLDKPPGSYIKRTDITLSSENNIEPLTLQQPANSSAFSMALANTDNTTQLGVHPTCFRVFSKHPSIEEPSHCGVARNSLLNSGPQDEPVFWRNRETWTYRSCNIVLRTKHSSSRAPGDTFTRRDIANVVSVIQSRCVNRNYEYRGGYLQIGRAEAFDVEVFGRRWPAVLPANGSNIGDSKVVSDPPAAIQERAVAQSSGTSNALYNAVENSLGTQLTADPSPDAQLKLEQHVPRSGLSDSQISALVAAEPSDASASALPSAAITSLPNNTNTNTSLTWEEPTCFHTFILTNPVDCEKAVVDVLLGNGQPTYPQMWTTRQDWSWGSCSITLVAGQATSGVVFSRLEIARGAGLILEKCATAERGYTGGHIRVGPGGVFRVQLLDKPMLDDISGVANGTVSVNTTKLTYKPRCYNDSPGEVRPIANPSDCHEAIVRVLLGQSQRTDPEIWTSRQEWNWGGCSIGLLPQTPLSSDRFSRLQIARDSEVLLDTCVTKENEYKGGYIPIGWAMAFDVLLYARPWAEGMGGNGSADGMINGTVSAKRSLSYEPACFDDHPGLERPPITYPSDCTKALRHIFEEGEALHPPQWPDDVVEWSSHHQWSWGSCTISLHPRARGARDQFERADIGQAALAVEEICVTGYHGYKGGFTKVGQAGVFDVAVHSTRYFGEGGEGKVVNETEAVNGSGVMNGTEFV